MTAKKKHVTRFVVVILRPGLKWQDVGVGM